MRIRDNIPLIEEAVSPVVSIPFVNSQCEGCTVQVTGTFATAAVKIQGLVDPESEEWSDLASIDDSDLALSGSGITKKGIYQIDTSGITRVRAVVSSVSGGYVSVYANFTEYAGGMDIVARGMAAKGGGGSEAAQRAEEAAQQAAESASSASTSAESAQNAADSASDSASAAQEWAEAAEEAASKTYKRYIARWDKVNAQMIRQGDAADITTDTANFMHRGTVNPNYDNPFDVIYPWSERRLCNIDIEAYMDLGADDDVTDCVVAWEGDTIFDYDHEYGVWVYTPEFWGDGWDDGTYRYFEVDDREVKGKHHFPAHIGGRWHGRDVTLTIGGEDKHCLIPSVGMPAKRIAMSTLHTYANNFGATLDNVWSMDASSLLYLVEYAHFNTQTKLGSGVSSLYSETDEFVQEDATESTVVKVRSALSANVIPNAILDIGTSKGGSQVGSFHIVSVEADGTDSTLLDVTLNEAVTVTTANYVSIHGKINTADEAIGGRSGFIGTDGKASAYYRGEQFYGNMFRYVLGAYHQGSDHHVFLAENENEADKYNAINVNAHKDTGVALTGTAGYAKALGMFRTDGLFALPAAIETGGSSSAPIGDYHYISGSNTVLVVGGNASNGTLVGRFYGCWGYPASSSYWNYGACPLLKNPPVGV